MHCATTVSLAVGSETVADIQIWAPEGLLLAFKALNYVAYVDHTRIPLHLLLSVGHSVFSTNSATTAYFAGLLRLSLTNGARVGLLGLAAGSSTAYVVFYCDGSHVKCTVLDFAILDRLAVLDKLGAPLSTRFVDLEPPAARAASNTSIFDKVLSSRRQTNQYTVPKPQASLSLSSLTLTTSDQISQALNKVILLGLRLRGLSSNAANENDRIAVQEIYLMVRRSAMFALRKYNYGFQQPRQHKQAPHALRLNDIQTIVEQLLQVFIDVDETDSPKPA